MKHNCLIIFTVLLTHNSAFSQSFFMWPISAELHKQSVNCPCDDCCEINLIAPIASPYGYQISMSTDGKLYAKNDLTDIYRIDTLTGISNLYFDIPDNSLLLGSDGLMAFTPNLFYTIKDNVGELYEINTLSGVITNLGTLPYDPSG